MRAALYGRVSTKEQREEGYSLRQQRDALREYCQQAGYEVIQEFEDDESGAHLNRTGLDALRDLVADGGVEPTYSTRLMKWRKLRGSLEGLP